MSGLRLVPDTNVIVASRKSSNPASPNRELIDRWLSGEYSLLYSRDPVDPDDIAFLLCALNGAASHIVSYDDDLLALCHIYREQLTICEPLEFLRQLKSATSGESNP